jgi:hypothetical protein
MLGDTPMVAPTETVKAELGGLPDADGDRVDIDDDEALLPALREALAELKPLAAGVVVAIPLANKLLSEAGDGLKLGDSADDNSIEIAMDPSDETSRDEGDADGVLEVDRLDVRLTPNDLDTETDPDSETDGVADGDAISDRDADSEREDVLEIVGDAEVETDADGVGPGRSMRSCALNLMNFTLDPAL